MTVSLDAIIKTGDLAVVAVSETIISARRLAGGVVLAANKRPVAVLVALDQSLFAFDPAGAPLTPAALEQLCPGAVADFLGSLG